MGCPSSRIHLENELLSGVVHSCDQEAVLVHSAQGLLRATRAAGCLLTPAPRDTVLLALLATCEVWVLTVLHQHAPQGTLSLPQDTTLSADTLHLQTRHTTVQGEKITLTATDMHLHGETLTLSARLLSLGGQALLQVFNTVQIVAQKLKERSGRKYSEHQTLHESITDLAERKAGRMSLQSTNGLRVRADHADIRAKTVLDLDAEHIKLG
ncbi:MAG: DUF3540 domain-containing protein [Bilophila sp.]